jgi:hypothetical protein
MPPELRGARQRLKRVAVIQSNYIPWKGYFDIIHDVELFIFHDDLQYTKNDWRNRNKIKTPAGADWLTIPVGTSEHRLICEVEIKDAAWQKKHWSLLRTHYARAPHFARYTELLSDIYLGRQWRNLSELNQHLIKTISRDLLGITTEFQDSRDLRPEGTKQDRLLDLLAKAGADYYLSGPAAKDYIEADRFAAAGIELAWKSYAGYPEYPQLFPPFEHAVSILDLLLNVGPEAPHYIWGWRTHPT